jgi:hypothetical protein
LFGGNAKGYILSLTSTDEVAMDSSTPSATNPIARPDEPSRSLAYRPSWREAIDNPWLMAALLFFVTAALGLPFLWISRGFSTVGKLLLTLAVLLWTLLVLWVFYLVMAWCLPRIVENWQMLKG